MGRGDGRARVEHEAVVDSSELLAEPDVDAAAADVVRALMGRGDGRARVEKVRRPCSYTSSARRTRTGGALRFGARVAAHTRAAASVSILVAAAWASS